MLRHSGATMPIVFSGDSMLNVVEPPFAVIADSLRRISPRGPGFFSLTRDDGSYVQVAGATLRLTVEYRQDSNGTFRHFVLGTESILGRTRKQINSRAGQINLLANEVLTVDNAITVFRCFYETGKIPDGYTLRDDTARFADGSVT
jgi:hypothetical protein